MKLPSIFLESNDRNRGSIPASMAAKKGFQFGWPELNSMMYYYFFHTSDHLTQLEAPVNWSSHVVQEGDLSKLRKKSSLAQCKRGMNKNFCHFEGEKFFGFSLQSVHNITVLSYDIVYCLRWKFLISLCSAKNLAIYPYFFQTPGKFAFSQFWCPLR